VQVAFDADDHDTPAQRFGAGEERVHAREQGMQGRRTVVLVRDAYRADFPASTDLHQRRQDELLVDTRHADAGRHALEPAGDM
jgi:hypothetical protein